MTEPISKQLDYLFNPRSVAVLGASNNPGKWGFGTFDTVRRTAKDIDIYPINPTSTEIMGVPAYKSVLDVPGPVDLAVIVIPPQTVPGAMRECAEKGVRAAVVISAGFRETGEPGAELEREVLEIAREAGIRFVGPNCNGHFNTSVSLHTTGGGSRPGPLGLISQSGNFGGHILGRGAERGIGFTKYVSSGNEADLHLEDYIEYLAEDNETKIILAYIEGLKEGRRFFELARKTTKKKPIIVMKVGRTDEGARAAQSHTGSLSGSDAVHEAAFRQSGVIRVDEVDDMFDIALALLRQPLPRGRRVGIVTGGGGFGVVATDACRRMGLEIPVLTEETVLTLSKYLQPRWSHGNPVDMAGDTQGSYPSLGTLLKAENIDAVLAVGSVGYPAQTPTDPERYDAATRERMEEYRQQMIDGELGLVDGLIERIDRHQKPLIITASTGRGQSPAIIKLEKNGFFGYRTPEEGARVLSYLVRYAEYVRGIED